MGHTLHANVGQLSRILSMSTIYCTTIFAGKEKERKGYSGEVPRRNKPIRPTQPRKPHFTWLRMRCRDWLYILLSVSQLSRFVG